MELYKQNNKAYVRDNTTNYTYNVTDEDLRYILDDTGKLLPDNSVRFYLELKYLPLKETDALRKGYTAKVVNLKKNVAEVQDKMLDRQLVNTLFDAITAYNNQNHTKNIL